MKKTPKMITLKKRIEKAIALTILVPYGSIYK